MYNSIYMYMYIYVYMYIYIYVYIYIYMYMYMIKLVLLSGLRVIFRDCRTGGQVTRKFSRKLDAQSSLHENSRVT